MPESAPSCAHDTIPSPQDTAVNMASSHFPSDDFVQSQIPASAQVYFEAEPSHVPFSFQYDLDFNSQALAEDVFSLTCDPYHFLPPSSSTQSGRLSMEHRVEPHQQWLRMDPNIPIIPQTILSYASSTYTGNSDNDIFAEITGSSHLAPPNDGTFPTYDANSYYMWLVIVFPSTFLFLSVRSPPLTTMLILWFLYYVYY